MTGADSPLATGWMACQAAGGKHSGGLRENTCRDKNAHHSHLRMKMTERVHKSYDLFEEMWWAEALRSANKQKGMQEKKKNTENAHTEAHKHF